MSYCESITHRPRKAKFEIKTQDHRGNEIKKQINVCRECMYPYIEKQKHQSLHGGKLIYIREMTWSETKTKSK